MNTERLLKLLICRPDRIRITINLGNLITLQSRARFVHHECGFASKLDFARIAAHKAINLSGYWGMYIHEIKKIKPISQHDSNAATRWLIMALCGLDHIDAEHLRVLVENFVADLPGNFEDMGVLCGG
jgi:hypothetical protein